MSRNHAYAEGLIKNNHVYSKLFAEHKALEQRIHELSKRPTGAMEIKALKKRRLMLVDNMIKIEAGRA